MNGICIISGTNRPGSFTKKIAQIYQQLLKDSGQENYLFSLEDLPQDIAFSNMFGNKTQEFDEIISKTVIKYSHFVFISPEYNGSFPGILKTFLDATQPSLWKDKKAALIGVSDGRAGNLRGMEHLTNILHYLKINVWYNKLPISVVSKLMDADGKLISEETLQLLKKHVEGFKQF